MLDAVALTVNALVQSSSDLHTRDIWRIKPKQRLLFNRFWALSKVFTTCKLHQTATFPPKSECSQNPKQARYLRLRLLHTIARLAVLKISMQFSLCFLLNHRASLKRSMSSHNSGVIPKKDLSNLSKHVFNLKSWNRSWEQGNASSKARRARESRQWPVWSSHLVI